MAPSSKPGIRFTVAFPDPHTHLFEIEMEIPAFREKVASLDVSLPVWAPGSYFVRHFARHVRDLAASANGRSVAVAKVERSRFRLTPDAPSKGPFRIRYRVYAHDLSVRTSHLDSSHAFGNGTNLFFYVEGGLHLPQSVKFTLPKGWRTTMALPYERGAFHARDYDELADSPFECGTHRILPFTVRGVPHELALYGKGNENTEQLVADLAKIVEQGARLFGGRARDTGGLPYERYAFITHLLPARGGGLEHAASCVCGLPAFGFSKPDSYRDALALFAHEHFHVWNVKRLRPLALGPFDYSKENHTHDLWAMEGVTSYYERLLLVRAGLSTLEEAGKEWGKALKDHEDTPGRLVQSLADSSFDTWIRLYMPDENSPNVSESYYRRGMLVALALDLTLRRDTGGRRSLDDVLRLLYKECADTGLGYVPGRYESAVSEVWGKDSTEFFARYVLGTETPDLVPLFDSFGLTLAKKAGETQAVSADFGWKTKTEEGKLVVKETYAGRAAYVSGVYAGDELVALNGFRATTEVIECLERDAEPGSDVLVTVFRRNRLHTVVLALTRREVFTYELTAKKKPTSTERRLREGWTSSPKKTSAR